MNGVLVDRELLEKVTAALKAAVEAINAVPGRLRDRPDYITHIPCDVACRLVEAEAALAQPVPTRATANMAELEAHWKAGFLRGAKFWYGRTEEGTMWQSEQNECWQASHELWPPAPGALRDARLIVAARLRALADALEVQG